MKKKSLFKSKIQMVSYTIIFIICIGLFIYISKIDFSKNIDSDNKRFSSLYSLVPEDNLYEFSDAVEVLNIIKDGSGVIFMGFPLNEWSNYYAYLLNESCNENGIDKIYYYDFYKDRSESNGTYETILNNLKAYVTVLDTGVKDLYAPTVIVVKKGDVIGFFDETAIKKGNINPEDYYSEYQKNIVKNQFTNSLKGLME